MSPIVGALVRIAHGDTVAALGLTNDGGSIALTVPHPGHYVLRVARIGHYNAEEWPVEVRSGDQTRVTLTVNSSPVELPTITGQGRWHCGDPGTDRAAAAAVWEQARSALVATQLSQLGPRRYRRRTFERDLTVGGAIRTENVSPERTGAGLPFRTLPPERLLSDGFVRWFDDNPTFFAPDAALIISDQFLASHCFRAVPGPDSLPGWIGLAFEPAPETPYPDIKGVLWVASGSGELQAVEFRYVSPRHEAVVEESSGRVAFRRHPTGEWYIPAWSIRMPRLSRARGAQPAAGEREQLSVVGYLESGGSAIPVEAPTSGFATTVTGHVFDSLSGRGLAGVVVRLAGADESTITDSVGTFVLKAGVVGPRVLTFDHELFSLAPTRREAVVQLTAGATTHVTTSIPGIKTVAGELCAGQPGGSGVLGLVRGQEGFETDAIVVEAVWFARAGTTAIRRIAERTYPDPRGAWAFCDLPGGQDISLLTIVRGSPVSAQSVRVVAGEFSWHVLARAADRTAVMLSGTVVDEDRAAPLEGVDIVVLELDRQATTGPEGAFQLSFVPPGTYRVLARRLGYQPLDTVLVVSEGRDLRVVVGLRRLPTVLPELSVEAPAMALSPNMTGFAERQRTTFGRHFTRDDLDRVNFSTLADLLRGIPRVTVILVGSEAAAASSTRTSIEGPRYERPWPSACYMQIVFDGASVWAPGRGTGRPYNVNQHSIRWLQGVEVYTGADTPIMFGGTGSACGTIVLWTRERQDVELLEEYRDGLRSTLALVTHPVYHGGPGELLP